MAGNYAALLELSYHLTRQDTTVWEMSLEEQRMRSQQQFAMLYYLGLQAGLSSVQAYNAASSAIRMDGASVAAPGYESVPSDYLPFNLESGSIAISNASSLKMSQTILNHMDDLIKHGSYAGEISRPYINSNGTTLLLDEIMHSAPPKLDSYVTSALRWDVQGTFRGSSGIWELVVDTVTNTVLHFNFVAN